MKTNLKLFIALALCLALCFALISCNDEHAHSPSNPVIENEVEGTCTTDHTYDEVVYCSTCNEEISRTPRNEGKGDHSPADAVAENEVAGTCTTDHTYDEVFYCSTCNEEISRTPRNEGKGQHNFVNGACTSCNKPEPEPSEGLEFSLNFDRVSYSVSGIGTCTDTDVVIPSSYNDLPVTSIGISAFSQCSSLTSITIPDSVTGIGWIAFSQCSSLTEITVDSNNTVYKDIDGNLYTKDGKTLIHYAKGKVATSFTLPYGVTNIGEYAFYGCTSLTSITISDSVTSIGNYAFSYCSSLTSITIPDSVTSIGEYAFSYCSSLTSITIPNSKTSIGDAAFFYCTSLTSITIPDSVMSIRESTFYGCSSLTSITIPDSVIIIGNNAFRDCSSLTSITIPDSVTSIGWNAFEWCTSLTSITIPYSVTSIDNWTFGGCSSLTEITIPDSVTSIGEWAFSYCSSLTEITIPDSVTSIGYKAFDGCSSLTGITIPDSVTSIGEWAFEGCSSLTIYCEATSQPSGWDSDWNSSNCPVVWDCNNNDVANDGYIYTVVDGMRYGIKDGVATVMGQPTSITEANIKSSIVYKSSTYSVTSIGSSAFGGCSSLTSITIPNSVTSIGNYAFAGCSSLTSITIPNSVTSIGEYAFNGCSSLTIYCEATSQPSGWDSNWNSNRYENSNCPVVWDCNNNDVADDGYIYTVIDGVRYGIKEGVATVMQQPTIITEANIKSSIVYKSNTYSVTSIGDYAFEGFTSLTSITIPDSVTSIGYNAFYSCSSLTSITIPDSVTSIGYKAFDGCSSLTIYCEATSQPSGWDSSWNSSNCPVVWGYTGEE